MKTLTAQDRDAMYNLKDHAERAFKSKRVLQIMSGLNEAGLIEFDPMAGTASVTDAGRAALASYGNNAMNLGDLLDELANLWDRYGNDVEVIVDIEDGPEVERKIRMISAGGNVAGDPVRIMISV